MRIYEFILNLFLYTFIAFDIEHLIAVNILQAD